MEILRVNLYEATNEMPREPRLVCPSCSKKFYPHHNVSSFKECALCEKVVCIRCLWEHATVLRLWKPREGRTFHRRCQTCEDPVCKACLREKTDETIDRRANDREESESKCAKIRNRRPRRHSIQRIANACEELECGACKRDTNNTKN